MARRSSARLRSQNSSTPQRVSLSHDAPMRTPRTVPARMAPLAENDEMPGAFPPDASPNDSTPTAKRARGAANATPKTTTPIKPSDEEMHPDRHHQTTARAMDEARYLGFSNMGAYTEPPKQKSRIATLQATPTRTHNPAEDVKSPTYQFTFHREHSLELSPEAKRLMNEKREEAARIRELMVASGDSANEALETGARKLVTPKGKRGRFSDLHTQQFQKMDSIAGHASSFRMEKSKVKEAGTPQQHSGGQTVADGAKQSLKRSPSKAQLDDQHPTSRGTLHRSPSKPNLAQAGSGLPRAASSHTLTRKPEDDSSSPAKRTKRSEAEDVSATCQLSSDNDKPLPATPQQQKTLRMHPSNPNLAALTTPTQASLARAVSVKSAKTTMIPAPPLVRSPSKHTLFAKDTDSDRPTTPLLARSPSKGSLFSTYVSHDAEEADRITSPLLSRTPVKASLTKKHPQGSQDDHPQAIQAPLLSRSPLKMSVAKTADSDDQATAKVSAIPLLARSPSKIAMPSGQADKSTTQTPGKSFGSGLMGRFNLLRASPKKMKSILRSPQRLYSDDPSKVAAGTHLATPPKLAANKALHSRPPPTPTLEKEKRVDFTSSTKDGHEGVPPATRPTPLPMDVSTAVQEVSPGEPMQVKYPSLLRPEAVSPSPQKRRQTVAPGDFTFRAGGHEIVFGDSPNAPTSARKRPASIRHISADDVNIFATAAPPPTAQGSKKRKFDFENEAPVLNDVPAVEDKENVGDTVVDVDEHRPAKRAKSNLSGPSPIKPAAAAGPAQATRLPTLGVKPKGVKSGGGGKEKSGRPSTISQARLNALSQPKRRG
ncbi:hypothetical protein LTR36_007078 [Oleoguttula mirabilis]|uniref:Erythromycin esterase n=1 Tax=Oleoguttula mirabilis TaxID=1507867 RepID=A0AAV9JAA3_9PEZI|nr:hypothetical protein LTR36_007078 [Oleoguttula mirabilis]